MVYLTCFRILVSVSVSGGHRGPHRPEFADIHILFDWGVLRVAPVIHTVRLQKKTKPPNIRRNQIINQPQAQDVLHHIASHDKNFIERVFLSNTGMQNHT